MSQPKLTCEELEQRCYTAEAMLAAIRSGLGCEMRMLELKGEANDLLRPVSRLVTQASNQILRERGPK